MGRRLSANIITFLRPLHPSHKDVYGKELFPSLPLSLDHVNIGNPPQSSSPLLDLPFELLGAVLEHVPSGSLGSLALVNHACQQWARSRQFANVRLDYSNASLGLLENLLQEGRQRSEGISNFPVARIGTCIRRITVATNSEWFAARHGVDDDFSGLAEEEKGRRMEDATHQYFKVYVPKIEAALRSQTLSNLQVLDWEDNVCLSQSFFQTLACSTIKHLRIYRAQFFEDFTLELLNWHGWSQYGTPCYKSSTHHNIDAESEAEWEQGHRERMLFEANKYVKAMPALRWIYFGHLSMGVEVHDRRIKRKKGKMTKTWRRSAHILSDGRDDDEGLLNRTFGGSNFHDASFRPRHYLSYQLAAQKPCN
ncbi:MAG: hypothetical protein Q9212_003467 [Teloschistes hypoglaucus]